MLESQAPYVSWFNTTAGEDLSAKAGYLGIRSGETVILHNDAATNAAARRSRAYVIQRGEISGLGVSLQYRGVATVVVGGSVTAGKYAVAKTDGTLIELDVATLVPGDQVIGEFLTTQATSGGLAWVDLDKGFIFQGGAGNGRRGNVLSASLAATRDLTVAECLQYSLIRFDPDGAGRTVNLPAAADLVTAGLEAGDFIDFVLENTADAAETLTMGANTGTTIDTGSPNLAQNKNAFIRIVVTVSTSGSEAARAFVYVS